MSSPLTPGWVTRMQSGFITVLTGEAGPVTCHIRGRLKRSRFTGDILSIGDQVLISLQQGGGGMVEEIVPRKSELARMDPRPGGEYRQILIANPDQVVMVFACAMPTPNLRMLDRFLVICEKAGILALIVANKVDKLKRQELAAQLKRFSDDMPNHIIIPYSSVESIGIAALTDAVLS